MKPIDQLSDDELVEQARRAAKLPDAPMSLIDAAIGLFSMPQCSSLCERARSALRLIPAVLSFASWAQPLATSGMRAEACDTRHLLFSAKGRDIDLHISPAAEHFSLSGQILGPDESGRVELERYPGDSTDVRSAALDSLGEFRLDGVCGGTYRVTLRVGGDEIVLPPVKVGLQP